MRVERTPRRTAGRPGAVCAASVSSVSGPVHRGGTAREAACTGTAPGHTRRRRWSGGIFFPSAPMLRRQGSGRADHKHPASVGPPHWATESVQLHGARARERPAIASGCLGSVAGAGAPWPGRKKSRLRQAPRGPERLLAGLRVRGLQHPPRCWRGYYAERLKHIRGAKKAAEENHAGPPTWSEGMGRGRKWKQKQSRCFTGGPPRCSP